MAKSKNNFLQHFLLLRSIYLPNFRKFHQPVCILPIFFNFCQFWLFFGQKRPNSDKIKKRLFCSIFFYWEASTYQISENFIKRLNFENFLHFWSILASFRAKKAKNTEIKNSFFVAFSFVGKPLQQELSTGPRLVHFS